MFTTLVIKKLEYGSILDDQMQHMSQDELVAYLVRNFREDYGHFEKYLHPFDFCERICECMEHYPEKVSIVKDEQCQYCGGTLIRLYYKESEEESGEFIFRSQEEDFLVICKECKELHDSMVLFQEDPSVLYGGPELPYSEFVIDPDNPDYADCLYGGPVEYPDDM